MPTKLNYFGANAPSAKRDKHECFPFLFHQQQELTHHGSPHKVFAYLTVAGWFYFNSLSDFFPLTDQVPPAPKTSEMISIDEDDDERMEEDDFSENEEDLEDGTEEETEEDEMDEMDEEMDVTNGDISETGSAFPVLEPSLKSMMGLTSRAQGMLCPAF